MVRRVTHDSIKRVFFFRCIAVVLLFGAAEGLRAQYAIGIETSNGPDNNPNQTTGGNPDIVGNNGLYLQDTLHVGRWDVIPGYTFNYTSFAKSTGSNYLSHLFEFSWIHPTLFMPSSVRTAIDERAASDSAETADTTNEVESDSAKAALVENLRRIVGAIESGGYHTHDTSAAPKAIQTDSTTGNNSSPADTTKDDENENDAADTTSNASATTIVSAMKDSSAKQDSTVVLDPIDKLELYFVNSFDSVADSLESADGSDSLKRWVERRVHALGAELVDSFPGDSTAMIIRDSVERFIVVLRHYVPPSPDTSSVATIEEVEENAIYAPLSLPRESLYDWSQSQLTLETTEDDTARYALELTGEYEIRKDLATGDSLGSHDATFIAVAHQAPTSKLNLLEQLSITNSRYTVFDTLNNIVSFGTLQGRWQPTPMFTALGELGYGFKHYNIQQIDTQQIIQNRQVRQLVTRSATFTSQIVAGAGAFWRPFRPTAIGGTVYYLHNPANNARVSANTYLVRRHGAQDISDDRFTYGGLNTRLFFKQQLFDDIELGLIFENAGRTYNQLAFKDVVRKIGKILLDQQVRTKDQRQDTYRNGELQLTRTWFFEHSIFNQLTVELLFGYLDNASNDPNFRFHEGYSTLNVSVDF